MSVLCIPDAQAVCIVCVGDEALVWRVLPQGPRSIFTKKHFRGGSADPGSAIRPLWSIKFHVKAKLMKDQPKNCAAVAAAQKTFR